ncbi:hypothetical protein CFP65_5280 [Kitasatospora sp. MMS16-BH015]|uniref:DUF6215 domain-containing protein n=1 Tax=Kitasatospora sp. MMS16-BH015 TaxID=2018025 RepID=UPI000CA1B38E|nr:DUF6215 domain-containing protein [Kitasatospora sp. MMS16-BH015]AUG79989.1 hypothetical protein CFP65_5280 [Kitasatospora sp. MMS16-BH015]
MAEEFEAPGRGAKVAGVVAAAVVTLGSVGLMVGWGTGAIGGLPTLGGAGATAAGPAACKAPVAEDPPGYPALCAAFNRPDLPVLVGAPTERVSNAHSASSVTTGADGKKAGAPAVEVQIGAVDVRVEDVPGLSLEDYKLFTTPTPTALLGHPALTYSDHTLAVSFALGGSGKSTTGRGGVAHHLAVAKGDKAGGGAYEISIWRQDDQQPDEAALTRIALKVLPTLPGWAAAQ